MRENETIQDVPPAVPEPSAVGLRWAIKRSFVDYVFRMPDGGGWVTDGATADGDNIISFEFDSADVAADGTTRWRFRGNVRFGGHGGLLFVQVLNPILTVVGDKGTLSVADPADDAGERTLDLVTVTLTRRTPDVGSVVEWSGDPVELTDQGVGVFNDVYAEGTLFEPMWIGVPAAATA